MADDFIAVGALGQKVDNTRLTVGGATVYRQRIILADDSDPLGMARILATAPAGTEMALLVRNIPSGTQAVSGTVSISGSIGVAGLVQTELPVATALADNAANPTAPAVGSFLMGWDSATWDRIASRGVNSDNLGGVAAGVLAVVGYGFAYNGTGWDRMRGTSANGLEVSRKNALVTAAYDYISLTQATLTDTYTFKTGGAAGTTVATLTITYTSSAKTTLSSVAKT